MTYMSLYIYISIDVVETTYSLNITAQTTQNHNKCQPLYRNLVLNAAAVIPTHLPSSKNSPNLSLFSSHKWILQRPNSPLPLQMSTPTPSSSSTTPNYLTNLGLGYSIAIALGFLVLLSTLLLASYICCRSTRHRNFDPESNPNNTHNHPSDGIILPRIIFVAEDDDQEHDQDDDNLVVGLDQAVINSYPKFQFTKDSGSGGFHNNNNTTCSICLCEYKDLEMLRMMPECRHYFHLLCIDAWLKLNGSCPVCRNSPLPTPLSTPLQEVVPLSQYAADRRRR